LFNEGKLKNKNLITNAFKDALTDYYYLLNKNYPEKETLKLVGDRFRLTGVQRTILFRGITSKEKASNRKSRRIPIEDLKGKELYIDGYNVLFTIMNYLLGKMVFIGNDGILRDSGGAYGKIEKEEIFYKAAGTLMDFVQQRDIENITMYLDQPVSNSQSHVIQLKKMQQEKIKGEVCLLHSVDNRLKQIKGGVIATSDSEIIDHTPGKIIDLARSALETTYGITILDLGSLTG
jgi:hypothetical protein